MSGPVDDAFATLRGVIDGAYAERNKLVCALSKVWPAHLCMHVEADPDWDPEWRWIVIIDAPTGQLSWHIHESERASFDHLAVSMGNDWDGHTTEQKYERLARLRARCECCLTPGYNTLDAWRADICDTCKHPRSDHAPE